VIIEVDPENIPVEPEIQIVSKIYDVSFAGGQYYEDFSVQLCFTVNTTRDACLGYLDESVSPPKWKCEDECLQRSSSGQVCGDTSHFTNFAILLGGGGSGGNACESYNTYVTGSFNGDLALCLACAGVCCCCFIFVYLCTSTAVGRRTFIGREGSRVRKMRKAVSHNFTESSVNYQLE
jgi:hypothetical protein